MKIDIEYAEWDALEDALKSNVLKNVKQIAIEFHVWSDQVQSYVWFHRILVALENAGFEKWKVKPKNLSTFAINQETGTIEKYDFQSDFAYINTNFLK